jgi:hypothetical protein
MCPVRFVTYVSGRSDVSGWGCYMLGRRTPYRTIVFWQTDRLQPWMSGGREGDDLRPASSDKSERLLRFNSALRYLLSEFALKVFSCRHPSKLALSRGFRQSAILTAVGASRWRFPNTRLRVARFQAGQFRNMSANRGRQETAGWRSHDAISPLRTWATGQGRLWPVGRWRSRCTPSFGNNPSVPGLTFRARPGLVLVSIQGDSCHLQFG